MQATMQRWDSPPRFASRTSGARTAVGQSMIKANGTTPLSESSASPTTQALRASDVRPKIRCPAGRQHCHSVVTPPWSSRARNMTPAQERWTTLCVVRTAPGSKTSSCRGMVASPTRKREPTASSAKLSWPMGKQQQRCSAARRTSQPKAMLGTSRTSHVRSTPTVQIHRSRDVRVAGLIAGMSMRTAVPLTTVSQWPSPTAIRRVISVRESKMAAARAGSKGDQRLRARLCKGLGALWLVASTAKGKTGTGPGGCCVGSEPAMPGEAPGGP
mmetsp:Transcript_103319/g.274831  ORF Transcript_103319/g.274831 Transcript_103319/m.274831 type:complete len:272 (-) Transcript_103319:22-837(-)